MITQRPKNGNKVWMDNHAGRKGSANEDDQNNVSPESPIKPIFFILTEDLSGDPNIGIVRKTKSTTTVFNDQWGRNNSYPSGKSCCGNRNLKAVRGTIEDVAKMMKADLLRKIREEKEGASN